MTAHLRLVPTSQAEEGARLTLAPLCLAEREEEVLRGLDALQYGAALRVLHHMVPRVRRRAQHFDSEVAAEALGAAQVDRIMFVRLLGASASKSAVELVSANRADLVTTGELAMRELIEAWMLWVKAQDGHDLRADYCLDQVSFIQTLDSVAVVLLRLINNFFHGPGPQGGIPMVDTGALPILGPPSFFLNRWTMLY